jgi:hypothetical protein
MILADAGAAEERDRRAVDLVDLREAAPELVRNPLDRARRIGKLRVE